MSELKSCPFCKGKAHTSAVCTRINVVFFKKFKWTVKCETEGCMAFYGCSFYRTEAEAVAAWNTRAERTCHIVKSSRKYVLSDGTELFEDGCSECNGYLSDGDNYCQQCGARVEEAD